MLVDKYSSALILPSGEIMYGYGHSVLLKEYADKNNLTFDEDTYLFPDETFLELGLVKLYRQSSSSGWFCTVEDIEADMYAIKLTEQQISIIEQLHENEICEGLDEITYYIKENKNGTL